MCWSSSRHRSHAGVVAPWRRQDVAPREEEEEEQEQQQRKQQKQQQQQEEEELRGAVQTERTK